MLRCPCLIKVDKHLALPRCASSELNVGGRGEGLDISDRPRQLDGLECLQVLRLPTPQFTLGWPNTKSRPLWDLHRSYFCGTPLCAESDEALRRERIEIPQRRQLEMIKELVEEPLNVVHHCIAPYH